MALPVIPAHDTTVVINVTPEAPRSQSDGAAEAGAAPAQLTQAERDAGRRRASAATREQAEAAIRQAQAAQQRNQVEAISL